MLLLAIIDSAYLVAHTKLNTLVSIFSLVTSGNNAILSFKDTLIKKS